MVRVVERNCTDIAAKGQNCSSERDASFMRTGEENNRRDSKKRKKGKCSYEISNDIITSDNEIQLIDDRHERKAKKRKHCNDSISGIQEIVPKSKNKGNRAEVTKFNDKEGGSSLAGVKVGDEGQNCLSEGDATFMGNGEENNRSNSKKRKKGKCSNEISNDIITCGNELRLIDDKHEKKTKKRKHCNDSISGMEVVSKSRNEGKGAEVSKFHNNEGGSSLAGVNMGDANMHFVVTNNDDQWMMKKNKKKKKLTDKNKRIEDSELKNNGGDPALAESNKGDSHSVKINMGDAGEHSSVIDAVTQGKKKKKKKKSKKGKCVTFSDQVEVFDDGFVHGKRFTPEEDEKVKEAVYSYIDSHGLGDIDRGVDMILHCKSYPQIRGCWKEIASALPLRPLESVYHRAHVLFERGENRKWTPEEIEVLRKFHENHGANWKMLADAMGKHRFHVKDTWRRIKLGNMNRGHWTQEEYEKLFDLVNTDLCLRALEDVRKLKYGMLRDNICWEAISAKVATRSSPVCCIKWYEKLTSPMVAQGEWTDTDDYRLLGALFTLDASNMEDVEWDHLLEHRSGDICRKRWNQMVQHIGEHGNKSFSEQVEILSKRYRPDLVEVREAFDNKPLVP